jgi:hypothetical protein
VPAPGSCLFLQLSVLTAVCSYSCLFSQLSVPTAASAPQCRSFFNRKSFLREWRLSTDGMPPQEVAAALSEFSQRGDGLLSKVGAQTHFTCCPRYTGSLHTPSRLVSKSGTNSRAV